MATLEELNSLLVAGTRIIDSAATLIRDIPLEPKEKHIRSIGEALALIFGIQQEIYKIEPSLEPSYLKQPIPFPGEGRKFGDAIIKAADYEHMGEFQQAISVYEEYISEGPPDMFVDMARSQIERIREEFSTITKA